MCAKWAVRTLMTASLSAYLLRSCGRANPARDLTLHLHYIKGSLKTTPKTTVYLMHPNPNTCAVMLLIAKGCRDSQAGRRRFDPGLPLQLFNNLRIIGNFFHSNTLR
jgi:hypothetical protein